MAFPVVISANVSRARNTNYYLSWLSLEVFLRQGPEGLLCPSQLPARSFPVGILMPQPKHRETIYL